MPNFHIASFGSSFRSTLKYQDRTEEKSLSFCIHLQTHSSGGVLRDYNKGPHRFLAKR